MLPWLCWTLAHAKDSEGVNLIGHKHTQAPGLQMDTVEYNMNVWLSP